MFGQNFVASLWIPCPSKALAGKFQSSWILQKHWVNRLVECGDK
jgi:hypothetical protein